jgi:hypothetical protein
LKQEDAETLLQLVEKGNPEIDDEPDWPIFDSAVIH